MMNNRSLQEEINKILLKEWDPIGIQNIAEARDEYSSYVSPVCELIISKKSEIDILNYLWWIETENMGLEGDKQHTTIIAKKLWCLVN